MPYVSIRDFGAVCDDTTDDTAAIQAAVDSVGDESMWQRSGLILHFDGPSAISGTINVRRKSIILQGLGWGSRLDTNPNRSYLRWIGPAGIPMLRCGDVKGLAIRNLRFVGNSAAKPSSAISMYETVDGVPGNRNTIESVYIGPHGGESDNVAQFQDGICIEGSPNNNAELMLSNVAINRVSRDGIHIGSVQNVNLTLTGLSAAACERSGIYNSAAIRGLDWGFANCAVDVMHPLLDDNGQSVNAESVCQGYFSEGAARMFDSPGSGRFIVRGSSFAVGPFSHADGKVIRAESAQTNVSVKLEDLRIFPAGTPTRAPYFALSAGSTGARHIVIDNVMGWSAMNGGFNGMDVSVAPQVGLGGRAYVFFRESTMTLAHVRAKLAQNFLHTSAGQWDINRYDQP